MSKGIKSLGRAVGFGGSSRFKAQNVAQTNFNIQPQSQQALADYDKLLNRSRAAAEAGAPAQTQVLQQLGQAALGRGPSLAEAQLKQAQDRTLAQQLAAVQAGRGGSAGANARGLIQAQSQAGRELASGAAEARLQERQNFLQAQQAADQGLRTDIAQRFEQAVAPQRELQQIDLANTAQQNEARKSRAAETAQRRGQFLQAVGQAGMALASDKNEKKDIKAAGKDIQKFLDKLSASKYKYKDGGSVPQKPKGENYGVMAQDLEKSKIGKNMVEDTPEGKMVNYGKGFSAILAAQAELNERLKSLESGKKPQEPKVKKYAKGGMVTSYKSKKDKILAEKLVQRYAQGGRVDVKERTREQLQNFMQKIKEQPEGQSKEESNKQQDTLNAAAKGGAEKLKSLFASKGSAGTGAAALSKPSPFMNQMAVGLKDGGGVGEKVREFFAPIRRSGLAGTGPKAAQDAQDEKKRKESAAERVRKEREQARRISNLKDGGKVEGPGTGTSDSIPAMLSNGEFVIRAKEAQKPKMREILERINKGKALSAAQAKALTKSKK